jgi:hypothetical protein
VPRTMSTIRARGLMSHSEEDAAKIDADLMSITISGVVLSPKERKVEWTPWPALNVVRLCFSLIIQISPVFFWGAAAALHVARPVFLVLLMVGVAYCCVYLVFRGLSRSLSKVSALEGQCVDWSIDATGVRRMSSIFDIHIKREGFASITEDKKRFLFFTSSQICIVLPKRCVNADQTASLRALISTWPQAKLRR